jgi:signal transduction histidine kinase
MKKIIRNLIIGKNNYIDSWTEYRQVILSGQFALISILLCIVYLIIDLSLGMYETMPVYLFALGFLAISLYLHRKQDHCTANYFLFPTLNLIIYLLASSESSGTGSYFLFIPIALGAFAVFNYTQRYIAVNFAGLTYILFITAYFGDFSLLPQRIYSEEELLFNFVLNFAIALSVSILAIYLLISLNHHNARALVTSNKLLIKSNEELDRFVYSTSHDLRAPLASVLGLISLSNRTENIDELKQYLNMMKQRVNSLDHFIKDITDYSRNNRTHINVAKIKLHSLAHEIWESLRYTVEAEAISFQINIPKELEVESDPMRLRTILSNLISNAIRYHDNRKENKYIQLSCHLTGESFTLHVEDNGQGIEPQHQKKIFDMFFRANENSQGSGLGLYIVKETIAKLSGSIQLQSVPCEGSIFTIEFPKVIGQ